MSAKRRRGERISRGSLMEFMRVCGNVSMRKGTGSLWLSEVICSSIAAKRLSAP
jgi:hypothetical protein